MSQHLEELEELKIEIEDLFEFLGINNEKYYETQISDKEIFIKTDTGDLTPILGYLKKPKKQIYKIEFENGDLEEVADTHIFRHNGKEVLAKDTLGMKLDNLEDGIKVTEVTKTVIEDVFDISIDNPHWYVHNDESAGGIISHNTLLCAHIAATAMTQGKNVAIFSFEDGEIAYSSRIDANLMNKTLDEMKTQGMALKSSFDFIIKEGYGTVKIKEYPPRGASAKNIRAQLDDWDIKDGFKPDVVIIDAINIASPVQKVEGLYGSGKYVAEDFRAIAVDYNVPVISPTQSGRGSYNSKSMGMEDVAESIGIVQSADSVVSFILDEQRPDIRIMSILKSRAVNRQKFKPTIVNCSTEYQRLWDLDEGERKYIKSSNKEVLKEMETIIELDEELSKSSKETGAKPDDMLGKLLSQNF